MLQLLLRCKQLPFGVRTTNSLTILSRFCSSTTVDSSNNGFIPVFKFPHIRQVSLINRLKWYQTVTTALVIPVSSVLTVLNQIELQTALTATVAGVGLSVFFYTLGYPSNKLIGIVYYNEKEESVRFAYLDFWGRRNEQDLLLSEIIPLCDNPKYWTDGIYFKVHCMSAFPETFKINLKFGGVVDRDKFKKIFMVD